MSSKNRIPRKLKKKIPRGLYCYKYTGKTSFRFIEELNQEVAQFHTKVCPFYKWNLPKDLPEEMQTGYLKEIYEEYPEVRVSWCKLVECEIEDQCKSCGIKKEF